MKSSLRSSIWYMLAILIVPMTIAYWSLELKGWDLSVPLIYRNADDIWQLILTKMIQDTGWILTNPFLGAPEVAHWHHNAAAQTSALHSLFMKFLGLFIDDAVRLQQVYYLLNFPLITFTSYIACRLLGCSRLPAFSVGLLFAFTTFRINEMLYAFLANYFAIPLAAVPVFWVIQGKFRLEKGDSKAWYSMVRSRLFLLSLGFVTLIASSDGYYAFFTLLLLGFATFIRAVQGDWRSPRHLFFPSLLIITLFSIVLALMIPLERYKHNHKDEFYPNGQQDSTLVKHAFEAEVYSSSLKLLIAPYPQHRVKKLANLGKWMVDTSDDAKKFRNGRALVPLGLICTIIFLVLLIYILTPASLRESRPSRSTGSLIGEGSSLSLFILLCATFGGIGTLVALIFPTIRGYDRIPLFLIFILLVVAGKWVSDYRSKQQTRGKWLVSAGIVTLTILGLLDQIPSKIPDDRAQNGERFLAERSFVHQLEASLPTGAMVFQYPYSQYLRQNSHYGWGAFTHVRLYLHSKSLRWSNGGAKNSPSDDWLLRVSRLPIAQQISEAAALGFRAVVVDRSVLSSDEYRGAKQEIEKIVGSPMIEDSASQLAFVKIPDPGYHITMDSNYRNIVEMNVSDHKKALQNTLLPVQLQATTFRTLFTANQSDPITLRPSEYPDLFRSYNSLHRGSGENFIQPITDMTGTLNCRREKSNIFHLNIKNTTNFDWNFNQGQFPLGIGVHFYDTSNLLEPFDHGFRAHGIFTIPSKSETEVTIQASELPTIPYYNRIEFQILQDGNAWFAPLKCSVNDK